MFTIQYTYPVDLTPDEDGHYVAVIPDLPGAITGGFGRDGALEEAADCLEEALARCISDGDIIPEPSAAHGRPTVFPGAVIVAKVALYDTMCRRGMSKTTLAQFLECDETEVRQMLNPRHTTKIDRLENILIKLGRRLRVTVVAA